MQYIDKKSYSLHTEVKIVFVAVNNVHMAQLTSFLGSLDLSWSKLWKFCIINKLSFFQVKRNNGHLWWNVKATCYCANGMQTKLFDCSKRKYRGLL